MDRFRRLGGVQGGHPYLAVFQKRDVAIGRNGGSPAIAQLPGRTAIKGNRINCLLRRLGKIPGIGNIAIGFEIAAPGIDKVPSVGAPGEIAQVLAVIFLIGREPAALVIRRGGYPEVPRSAFIQDPGNFTAAGRGNELRREGRAQVALYGSRGAIGPENRDERQETEQ